MKSYFLLLIFALAPFGHAGDQKKSERPFLRSELLFPLEHWHNHGSCLIQCPNGDLLVCWYHGSGERTADDVVVLMSDGLPERFNPNDEMLDDERIQQALPALARQSSEQIIAALIRLGDDWSEGRAQDDDITFVVLKTRSAGNGGR